MAAGHSATHERILSRIGWGLLLALAVSPVWGANPPQPVVPWGAAVTGFVEPQPGEHPRLLFRKADIPALRAKAQTPLGRKMVARLRTLLYNDGEALPRFDNVFPLNGTLDLTRPGHFTIGASRMTGEVPVFVVEEKTT
jgi:hypothetical protein